MYIGTRNETTKFDLRSSGGGGGEGGGGGL